MQCFAHRLGETEPIFDAPMAARAQGYPDIVAPPSFPAVIDTLANDEQRRRGELPLTEVIGCDFHHLLHVEQHFTYADLMYAGDDLFVTPRVEDFYQTRGGMLVFVFLRSVELRVGQGCFIPFR